MGRRPVALLAVVVGRRRCTCAPASRSRCRHPRGARREGYSPDWHRPPGAARRPQRCWKWRRRRRRRGRDGARGHRRRRRGLRAEPAHALIVAARALRRGAPEPLPAAAAPRRPPASWTGSTSRCARKIPSCHGCHHQRPQRHETSWRPAPGRATGWSEHEYGAPIPRERLDRAHAFGRRLAAEV